MPSVDSVFGTVVEKSNLGPPSTELVLRLAASRAIPPRASTPLQTPELMSTAPFISVAIITVDMAVRRGFDVV